MKTDKSRVQQSKDDMLRAEAVGMEEIRKPLLHNLRCQGERIRIITDCSKKFKACDSIALLELEQGSYKIHAAKKQATRFGESYKLLIELNDVVYVVWSNTSIDKEI